MMMMMIMMMMRVTFGYLIYWIYLVILCAARDHGKAATI